MYAIRSYYDGHRVEHLEHRRGDHDRRADEVFAREPELRDLQRQRQDSLRELQELYRMRLDRITSYNVCYTKLLR